MNSFTLQLSGVCSLSAQSAVNERAGKCDDNVGGKLCYVWFIIMPGLLGV